MNLGLQKHHHQGTKHDSTGQSNCSALHMDVYTIIITHSTQYLAGVLKEH